MKATVNSEIKIGKQRDESGRSEREKERQKKGLTRKQKEASEPKRFKVPLPHVKSNQVILTHHKTNFLVYIKLY